MKQATQQPATDPRELANAIRRWGEELGFQQIGFSDIDLAQAEKRLAEWLDKDFHGEMSYMSRHGAKRSRPELLVPGTLSVISARMDYLADDQDDAMTLLDHDSKAYVSRYALGRDYHNANSSAFESKTEPKMPSGNMLTRAALGQEQTSS